MKANVQEGIFLELTEKERAVFTRVLSELGQELSPNGIIGAFVTLDKYLAIKNAVQGKENISEAIKKFLFR